jgi:hypothetical protein
MIGSQAISSAQNAAQQATMLVQQVAATGAQITKILPVV